LYFEKGGSLEMRNKNVRNNLFSKAVVVAIATIFICSVFIPAVDSQVKNISTEIIDEDDKILIGNEESNKKEIFLSKDDSAHIPLLNTKDAGDPWWNTEWPYRKETIINHSLVDSDLVNFPILISLSTDSNLSDNAQSDGDDLVFIDNSTGNKLNHEIEYFDDSTGKLLAWVNITSLSSSVDTILYMYYGNPGCSNQQNPSGVWDSEFLMVQHLEEDPSGGAPQMLDSTSNDNDGICYGGMTAGDQISGQVDGSLDLDSNDYVDCNRHNH
jgi:hypothetical protein